MTRLHPIVLPLIVLTIVPFADTFAADEAWKPANAPIFTPWAKDVKPSRDSEKGLHPRPQLRRMDAPQILDGLWDYAITPKAQTKFEKSDGKILVPFCVESALSGVDKKVGADDALWYRLNVKTNRKKDQPVMLHFGAVDWETEVFVNGKSVGKHRGGYDPFSFNITSALSANSEQEIIVRVTDPTDAGPQPRGKQVRRPEGIWYTPTTGIWQTVWIEYLPSNYIRDLTITPDVDSSSAKFLIDAPAGDVRIEISHPKQGVVKKATGKSGQEIVVPLENAKLWAPGSPELYDVRITLANGDKVEDAVDSYFAMRKISLGKDEQGITRILLNNKFVFQSGPLDQGFWPDGLYTAPTDAAMKYDLELTQEYGFNMVRKHVKVEPARWYRYCDEMGLLVWQDMPSGDRYIGPNDPDYQRTGEAKAIYYEEWKEIIKDLKHFPCIVMWVPFNEGWGQFDTKDVVEFTRKQDPTRLVNNASGWSDRGLGDVNDAHIYPGPGAPKVEEKRAIVLGEFGGLGLPLEGHTWQGKDNWGYRSYTNKDDLNNALADLFERLPALKAQGLSAAVYTQTTDVEIEVNGLVTYDRKEKKIDPAMLREAHTNLDRPAPETFVVVPTSESEPATWSYTTDKPADGWEQANFDDTKWKSGPGGFGEPSTPGSKVRTNWKTEDIWLRRKVKFSRKDFDRLVVRAHWDEDSEIYINGKLIKRLAGYSTEYRDSSVRGIDRDTLEKWLADGEVTIAVHTHQTGGGQYIDVGLLGTKVAK